MKSPIRFLVIASMAVLAARASAQSTRDIQLGWSHSPTPEQGKVSYNLYMAQGASAFSLYATTTNHTMTVTNLVPALYTFQVTATNLWTESLPSLPLSTPAAAVTNAPSLVFLIMIR